MSSLFFFHFKYLLISAWYVTIRVLGYIMLITVRPTTTNSLGGKEEEDCVIVSKYLLRSMVTQEILPRADLHFNYWINTFQPQ